MLHERTSPTVRREAKRDLSSDIIHFYLRARLPAKYDIPDGWDKLFSSLVCELRGEKCDRQGVPPKTWDVLLNTRGYVALARRYNRYATAT